MGKKKLVTRTQLKGKLDDFITDKLAEGALLEDVRSAIRESGENNAYWQRRQKAIAKAVGIAKNYGGMVE